MRSLDAAIRMLDRANLETRMKIDDIAHEMVESAWWYDRKRDGDMVNRIINRIVDSMAKDSTVEQKSDEELKQIIKKKLNSSLKNARF